MARLKIRFLAVAFLVALPFIALLTVEGLALLPLRFPRLLLVLPRGLSERYRRYYFDFDRDIVQYNERCAQYSADLFYTLKPGACTFTNREYSVAFHINGLGVRDDEESLRAPQVAVLGDSQAMGWAVDQRDTFAEIIQRDGRLRVLNTAVSSYGTARELKMLGKVDRTSLRYVVLQYCDNDLPENEEFLAHGHVLPIAGRETYEKTASEFRNRRKPWLSAYLLRGMLGLGQPSSGGAAAAPTIESTRHEVSVLVTTLANAGISWDGLKLIVFEIDGTGGNNPMFAAELRRELSNAALPAALRSGAVLDFAPALTPRYYRVLDDHLNPDGHRLVASAVLPLLSN